MSRSLFVLFVSGWSPQAPLPLLGEAMTNYPMLLMRSQAQGLYDRYRELGLYDTEHAVAALLEQQGLADLRFADPDRYGPLTEAFDGGSKPVHHLRKDTLIPFPPGPSL